MSQSSKSQAQKDPFRQKKGKKLFALLLLAVMAGAGYYYWELMNEEEVRDQPLIATVEVGNIENAITAAGSLKPSSFVDVGAQVNGLLERLHVEVGDLVEPGQLLAEIDARVQENRVDAARASIEALEAQLLARRASLDLARANAARQQRLMSQDATSELDYDTAMANLASAESNLIQLEAQIMQNRASLASDETTLEFSKIFAPNAGTVVSIEMNEGRTINANQTAPTILRIADLSTMTVETDISEADIGNIRKGMDVYFTTLGGGNRRWYSTLRQILPTPRIDNNVVLYTGLFDITNEDGSLLSEMTAQVFFITSSAQNVKTVPLGALTFKDQPLIRAGAGQGVGRPAGAPPSGFRPPEGGSVPQGVRPGTTQAGGGQGLARADNGNGPPRGRLATVELVREDGSFEEREVLIGVTSRIAAEVISGLEVGDRVVAGIVQGGRAAQQQGQNFRPPGGFGGGIRVGGF